MAKARRVHPLIRDYLIFALLLLVRFGLDAARFPVDGYARLTPVAVIETQVFYVALHYAVYLLLRANRVPIIAASRVALVTMAAYLYLHLLEYFFYAGGRADGYAPAGHLLANLLGAFLITGDAGFWQVMRIFVCGSMLLLYLLHRGSSLARIGAGMLLLYLWGMLLVHPDAWLFAPQRSESLPSTVLEQGVPSFIISAWCLLLITLAARIERWRAKPGTATAAGYSSGWVLGLILVLLWQPMLTGTNASVSFVLLQCAIILHLALGMPRLGRLWCFRLRSRDLSLRQRALGGHRRNAEAPRSTPQPQSTHRPDSGSWLRSVQPRPMAMTAATAAPRGCGSACTPPAGPQGRIRSGDMAAHAGVGSPLLVGDLVRTAVFILTGAILASLWGLVGPVLACLVVWVLLEGLLLAPRRRRSARRGALLGLGFGIVWVALSLLLPSPPRVVEGPFHIAHDQTTSRHAPEADQQAATG